MHVETRHDRSLGMKALMSVLSPIGTFLVKPGKPTAAGSQKCKPSRSARRRCDVVERQVDGIWLYDLLSKDNDASGKLAPRRIYYFCGGGFQSPPSGDHWAFLATLACETRLPVTLVAPPLAPNSPAKNSLPQLEKLYYSILAESAQRGEEAILMGDSSGGNLALAVPLLVLSKNPEASAPACIFLISPCVDTRNDNPEMKIVEQLDPILSIKYTGWVADTWTRGMNRADPSVSPILADLSILRTRNIRLNGVVGKYDVLTPDTLLLLDKVEKLGVYGRWLVWHHQMHCFPLASRYGLSDSVAAKDWIVAELLK